MSNRWTVADYIQAHELGHVTTEETRHILAVDRGPDPMTMRDFLDRAKIAYLTYLMETHDGNRAVVSDQLQCTPQNLANMLAVLVKRYGDNNDT